MKPKLLVLEFWGIGDLAIATPFLQEASKKYEVTLLAKPFAHDLQKRFWPEVKVVSFTAPWTAFKGKYNFYLWPWISMFRLWRQLQAARFDLAISARRDPRDHFLLWLFGARNRLGFPRLQGQKFLTQSVGLPNPEAHRYESWRQLASALDIELPKKEQLHFDKNNFNERILVHTGAARSVRVWPLVRFRNLVNHLRRMNYEVQVVCDPGQRSWWLDADEENVATPTTLKALLKIIEMSGLFIGNDSGPGHLAAISGCPTFTIFGPQLPEWFTPLHPEAECIEGKACPYKPCFDYCQFPAPHCLLNVSEEEVLRKVENFVANHFQKMSGVAQL